ncbi:MAG: hypothetical protein E8D45_07255 [Nitrospira sp.]|nr:MAG: hypothetical protein E8D45_07255 [Nitrospira sp.]
MIHRPRCRRVPRVRLWGAGCVVLTVLLSPHAYADTCPVAEEHGGLRFPVEKLSAGARCAISEIVEDATTKGVTGPIVTPNTPPLYEFLLDRPPMSAGLVTRLELGQYECSAKGDTQFWVNDHDGTQGLFTLLYQDVSTRIYAIDGFHEGRIVPRVKANAVVFLRFTEARTAEGTPAVESTLITYTKLNDPLLAFLVRLLRPLITGTVTRKLAKGFEVINQLGAVATRDPERFLNEVAASGPNGQADVHALRPLLAQASPASTHVSPATPSR